MAENQHFLGDPGKSLEDEFFRKEDERAIKRLRELQQSQATREALRAAAGISDVAVLDRLIALGIRPEIVSALSIVPLLEVAWADGSLDAKERTIVLERAATSGVAPGSAGHDLLQTWLERKPDAKLFSAWTELVRGLAARMSSQEMGALKSELIERAQALARASGGVFGVGSVSAAERDAIQRLETAFGAA